MSIKHQVHDKFKVFAGTLAADHTLGTLAAEVEKFTVEHKVAAKSIGVAYLEHARQVIVTLGYRNDVDPYPVKLKCVPLGKINIKQPDHHDLEKKLAQASDGNASIVCHELYITEDDHVMMVLMSHG